MKIKPRTSLFPAGSIKPRPNGQKNSAGNLVSGSRNSALQDTIALADFEQQAALRQKNLNASAGFIERLGHAAFYQKVASHPTFMTGHDGDSVKSLSTKHRLIMLPQVDPLLLIDNPTFHNPEAGSNNVALSETEHFRVPDPKSPLIDYIRNSPAVLQVLTIYKSACL